jgi:hypothetical protein
LTEDHQGYIHICAAEDFAEALEKYYLARPFMEKQGALAQETLTKKYAWPAILAGLNEKLLGLVELRSSI